MYLDGTSALSLLTRYRIPTVFGVTIDFEPQHAVMVEPTHPLTRMLRLNLNIDRELAAPVLSVAITDASGREGKVVIDTLHGLHNYQVVALANALELPRKSWQPLVDASQHLYRVLITTDALAITLDPLAMESNGRLVTLDARIHIDDSANFRHPEFAIGPPAESDDERLARMAGISYVRLEGEIGVLANGAGLALATMDVISATGSPYGLRPANFMDIGGGARSDTVETGVRLLLGYLRLKSLVLNVFGGMTRADEVAQGIISACTTMGLPVPLILRLEGIHSQTGRERLAEAGFPNLRFASSLNQAVKLAIDAARGER